MIRLDKNRLDIGRDEILGFARIRNEALRLPYFLQHHRNSGVDRFFFVDNNSDDAGAAFLSGQPDVHVFWTDEAYRDNASGMNWVHKLLNEYGTNHWCLTLDPDELLVFPYSEERNLRILTRYLQDEHFNAFGVFMLDMYSSKPIVETVYQTGRSFLDFCRYFDCTSEQERQGARSRIFWSGAIEAPKARPPYLKKIPLVYWDAETHYKTSTHIVDGVREADITGALLHFKFFSDFIERVNVAVSERQYWNDSEQYEQYQNAIKGNAKLAAFDRDSVFYRDSKQLIALGLIKTSPRWDSFW